MFFSQYMKTLSIQYHPLKHVVIVKSFLDLISVILRQKFHIVELI